MSTAIKWAIAIGVVSFGVTLWMLRTDPRAPQSAPAPPPSPARAEAQPAPAAVADFHAAMGAADRTGSTPEGLKYQEEASPALSNVLRDRLASCLGESSPLGQADFTIVVGVAPNGVLRSTWASPETPLASCILHRLAGAALPPPPIPDVWIAANIRPDTAAPEGEPETAKRE